MFLFSLLYACFYNIDAVLEVLFQKFFLLLLKPTKLQHISNISHYFATVYKGQVQVFKTGGGSTALHRLDDLTVSQHGASSTTSTVSAWRPAAAVGTLQRLDL